MEEFRKDLEERIKRIRGDFDNLFSDFEKEVDRVKLVERKKYEAELERLKSELEDSEKKRSSEKERYISKLEGQKNEEETYKFKISNYEKKLNELRFEAAKGYEVKKKRFFGFFDRNLGFILDRRGTLAQATNPFKVRKSLGIDLRGTYIPFSNLISESYVIEIEREGDERRMEINYQERFENALKKFDNPNFLNGRTIIGFDVGGPLRCSKKNEDKFKPYGLKVEVSRYGSGSVECFEVQARPINDKILLEEYQFSQEFVDSNTYCDLGVRYYLENIGRENDQNGVADVDDFS